MISLTSETLTPAIQAYLDAVAKRVNGSPVLLKIRADEPLVFPYASAISDFVADFLRTPLFHSEMLEVDKRKWLYCFHDLDENGEWKPSEGTFVRKSGYPSVLHPMSILSFAEHLHSFLTFIFSPYHTGNIEESTASNLIQGFLSDLFGDDIGDLREIPTRWTGLPHWINQPWRFYKLLPSFLYSTGYFNELETADREAGEFPYFDSGSADSAIFFYKEDVFCLLLTNGSP